MDMIACGTCTHCQYVEDEERRVMEFICHIDNTIVDETDICFLYTREQIEDINLDDDELPF